MSALTHEMSEGIAAGIPVEELRRCVRHPLLTTLPAVFSAAAATVIDLSISGAMATHEERLTLGKRGLLTLTVPGEARRVTLSARVVWSRIVQSDGRITYLSGFAIGEDDLDAASLLLDRLLAAGYAGDDERSLERKRKKKTLLRWPVPSGGQPTATPAQALDLARRGTLYLKNRPALMEQWKKRAARPGAESTPEAMAVWEFLGRGVDLAIIKLALELW